VLEGPMRMWLGGLSFTAEMVIRSAVINLAIGITNIIGPRAFLNFSIGRYHTPVEENRFVLFVDIADRPALPSGSAASPFTACSTTPFACSPFRWWIIAVRCSIMSATR
jgi:hypothetical protein